MNGQTEHSAASDWLLLLVPGTIWGASFLFIAEGLDAIAPNGLTFLRILVGFLTLGTVAGARRAVPREDLGRLALLGLVWMAFPLSMFPFAEQRVSSALTGMLNAANPLFTAIISSIIARQLPSRGVGIGLLVGLTGTVMVAWPSLGEGRSSVDGVLLILIAMVSYGIALNVARPLQQRNGALPVIWRCQAFALLLTAPLGVRDVLHMRWMIVPLLSIVALGALGTGLAFVVAAIATGRLGATRASATAFLIPGVALVLGVVFRGDRVALLSIIGSVVCVAGAWIIRRAGMQPPVRT